MSILDLKNPFLFPREQKFSCKLTKDDIDEIKSLRKTGLTFKEIGKKFKVSDQTVYYWCLSEEERIKRRSNKPKYKYNYNPKRSKEYRERKKMYMYNLINNQ